VSEPFARVEWWDAGRAWAVRAGEKPDEYIETYANELDARSVCKLLNAAYRTKANAEIRKALEAKSRQKKESV
jgi:hypothetical protein